MQSGESQTAGALSRRLLAVASVLGRADLTLQGLLDSGGLDIIS